MRSVLASTAVALAIALGLPATAGAQMRGLDRVYADPFGNLVISGATGYKRIVVGEGRSVRQLPKPTIPSGPDVSQLGPQGEGAAPFCYSPPMLVWGRSYMYGFHEGPIPQLGRVCR